MGRKENNPVPKEDNWIIRDIMEQKFAAKVKTRGVQTLGEELFNSISHGVGTLLAIAGLVIALVYAAVHGSAWGVVSAAVYGATLIILYSMSTLYHAFPYGGSVKKVFRVFDHCSIFLLIAGTYMPYTLVTLRGVWGWTLFGVIWGFAIIGIVFNSINLEKYKNISAVCYVVMGWAIIIALKPLMSALPFMGLVLLMLGGAAYMLGLIFYANKKIPFMHPVWHLFVLAGSVLHFFSILFYVLPKK